MSVLFRDRCDRSVTGVSALGRVRLKPLWCDGFSNFLYTSLYRRRRILYYIGDLGWKCHTLALTTQAAVSVTDCDSSITTSHVFHCFQWLLVYTTTLIKAWTSEGRVLRKKRGKRAINIKSKSNCGSVTVIFTSLGQQIKCSYETKLRQTR